MEPLVQDRNYLAEDVIGFTASIQDPLDRLQSSAM
jgi:hypothetical protein